MKLIVGLGNPGREYEKTYHNVGFMAIEYLSCEYNLNISKNECKALTDSILINNEKCIFAKPQTFMNLSGESVLAIKQKYKIDNKDIYVFCDDIDLPLGKIRFRPSGSGGTHNGLKNIVNLIGEDFNRIRIGIGRDERFRDLADYVLSKIPNDRQLILDNSIKEAVKILISKIGE